MRFLADLLRSIPSAGTDSSLADLGCHGQTGETVFVNFCEVGAQGMKRVEGKGGTFLWELDRDHANLFAEMVEVLASSDHGHQYLECGTSDEIAVNVSCCEYPDGFLIE
jgi:hypothetical protein